MTGPETSGPSAAGPSAGEPSAAQAAAAVPESQWRRVHRVTPLLNAWKVAAVIVAVAVVQGADDLLRISLPIGTLLLIVLGVVVLAALIGLVYSWFAWRRTSYAITADAVVLRSGILFRKERVARLTRVQAVEVTQPILGRIFGFAAVRVESAGGSEANLSLSYLTQDEAQDVRNEILARAAGVDLDQVDDATVADVAADAVIRAGVAPDAAGQDAPTGDGERGAAPAPRPRALAPQAPEHEVFRLPAGRLLLSLVAHGATIAIVLGVAGVVVAAILSGGGEWMFSSLFGLLGAVGFLWGRFSTEFNFRVATSPDGLRVRHGLLETKARTIPPGRIQMVQVMQGPIWRRFGWWRVRLTLANQGAADGTETSDVLLPVGSQDEALMLLRLAVPDLEDHEIPAVLEGMRGIDDHEGWVPSPRRARWLDPIAYRRNAFRVLDHVLALRTGRIFRQFAVVPHERTQSLGVSQGPLERRLALVSFTPHTSGSIEPKLPHLDAAVAAELMLEQARRARSARQSAGPEQWMRRDVPDEVPAGPETQAPEDRTP